MRGVAQFTAGVLVALCYLAFVGGTERARWERWHKAPLQHVDTSMCSFDKGAWYAVEYNQIHGVYHIHCRDGQVMLGGIR